MYRRGKDSHVAAQESKVELFLSMRLHFRGSVTLHEQTAKVSTASAVGFIAYHSRTNECTSWMHACRQNLFSPYMRERR